MGMMNKSLITSGALFQTVRRHGRKGERLTSGPGLS